jgi:hypothetical protein
MDDPILEEHKNLMNTVAHALDHLFNQDADPKQIGFVLLIAKFGEIEDGKVNYISNANRSDMIAMMKEYIARHESKLH